MMIEVIRWTVRGELDGGIDRKSSKSVRIGEPEIERALKIMIVTNFHAAHFYTSIGLPLFSDRLYCGSSHN